MAVAALVLPSAAAAQDSFSVARDGHADIELDATDEYDNVGYSEQPGEVLDCAGAPYGRTAWYRFRAQRNGTHWVTTLESEIDTVLSVYRAPAGSGLPTVAHREACNDDIDFPDELTSFVDFTAQAGRVYYVQVGGRGFTNGTFDEGGIVLSAFQPPANDNRSAAKPIGIGQNYDGHNFITSEQPGERLNCDGIPYGSTTWFKLTAPAVGQLVANVSSTDMDPVVAIYRGGSATPINCNDDAAGQTYSSNLSVGVTPGEYYIQVGGVLGRDEAGLYELRVAFGEDLDRDKDGSLRGADCDDSNPGIRPGAPEAVNNEVDENCDGTREYDRDGDGSRVPGSPGDCDDGNPARSPLKAEVPGNKLDENCDNVAAPFPVIASRIVAGWGFGKVTRLREMILGNAVRGSKVTLRCRGKGCRFKKKTIRVRRDARQLKLHKKLTKRQRGFGPKARLVIRISGPKASPKETKYKMRPGRVPTRQDFCITDRRRRC